MSNKKSGIKDIIDFCIPIVIAVALALCLRTFVFANAVVPTGSMLNTIQEGDRIVASRLAYNNNDPERYDIILFHYPDNEKEIYVKRIIGLPGETVQIVNGVVYVTKTDGKTIQLDDSFITTGTPYGDFGPYEVPEDSYFMLGDNRNNSKDSRYWQNTYVKRDKIIGEEEEKQKAIQKTYLTHLSRFSGMDEPFFIILLIIFKYICTACHYSNGIITEFIIILN